MNNLTWKIGGDAGFGIMTTGLLFSRICARHGYNIFDYVEYPSLIKGGHNVYEVRVSEGEVFSQEKKIDFLLSLNKDTVNLHKGQLKKGSIILYDGEQYPLTGKDMPLEDIELYNVPLAKITKEAGADRVMMNNVSLGATIAVLGMKFEVLHDMISQIFVKKGSDVIEKNQNAAKAGYDFVKENPPKKFNKSLPLIKEKHHIVISGNEALAMGAIVSGCKMYIAYPMTPASSILHFMASFGKKWGVLVKHAEDEISVINMAIGASYAGVRSMVATAGGGFSLMVEGLGLAAITETPLVIVVGQRPGPATGMPTWTGQGDLHFVINASQDEFPRIVLAPGDMSEAFYLTAEAFNLADRYQLPVIILTDKYLAESHASVPVYDLEKITIDRGKLISFEKGDSQEEFLRYKITEDGVSQRALPGMKKAVFTANSYEHNQYGYSTEDAEERIAQVDRRNRKLTSFVNDMPGVKVYGDKNSDFVLIGWGSSKGPILQALHDLKNENSEIEIKFVHLSYIWPFPKKQFLQELEKCRNSLLIEGNSQAQLSKVIKMETGVEIQHKYLRYDGRPFYPSDITLKIKEVFT